MDLDKTIIDLYTKQNFPITKIGKFVKKKNPYIKSILEKYNIKIKPYELQEIHYKFIDEILDRNHLINLYDEHKLLKNLALYFECNSRTISTLLKYHHIPLKSPEEWAMVRFDKRRGKPLDEQEIINLYESGYSYKCISKELNAAENTIIKIIKNNNLNRTQVIKENKKHPRNIFFDKEKLLDIRNNFTTLTDAAKHLKCSVNYLKSRLKEYNIPIWKNVGITKEFYSYRLEERLSPYNYKIKNISTKTLSLTHTICHKSFEFSKHHIEEYLLGYYNINHLCPHCTPRNNKSNHERDICEFLDNHKIEYVHGDRTLLSGKELDIFIDRYKLAIEFNGLYWHSEKYKDRTYHKEKYDLCKEKGIRLIQIFEDEWCYKPDMIKSKILNVLNLNKERIFARKTKIVEVVTKEKQDFFNQYHIQGDGPSSINYGLEYDNELVACIGFIKNKDGSYYLNRYATSCSVVGGFTKLLSHFEKLYNNPRIITFADLRWSEGALYYKTGFKLDKTIEPDYYWVKGLNRWHKFNFRHTTGLKKLENYDPNLSETDNMHDHGYYRIYDAGKLRFIKN